MVGDGPFLRVLLRQLVDLDSIGLSTLHVSRRTAHRVRGFGSRKGHHDAPDSLESLMVLVLRCCDRCEPVDPAIRPSRHLMLAPLHTSFTIGRRTKVV